MAKIIIWGSEGGIGKAVLGQFRSRGWEAAAVARRPGEAGDESAGMFQADFSRSPEVDRVGAELAAGEAGFDVMVYAAGDIASEKIRGADPVRWKEILDNNLTGVFHALRASLPLLNEGAHIFLLGAVSERLRLPGLSAYAAAKAGLEALAVSLSKEERKLKITVVRPGAVDTDLWEKVPFKKPAHTYPPEKVAERIWEAYQAGEDGTLDLV